ncbi:MAG: hypothetical protein CM1200mP12_21570 [Gammaproteobacteria bacterium]|nr:MAG: hypothetical protein CM1200mP12_21570 [Gammaproteobacteria bacterium]
MEDIKQVEQWYRLNKSKNMKDWLDAMKLRSIVSFNAVYADKESNIIFLHNSSSPKEKKELIGLIPLTVLDLLLFGMR